MTKPTTVTEYIETARDAARDKVHEIRAVLKKAAPTATEKIKWENPVFEEGRILFSYAAFRSHLNFMPTRSSLEPFQEELTGYQTRQGHYSIPLRPTPSKRADREDRGIPGRGSGRGCFVDASRLRSPAEPRRDIL